MSQLNSNTAALQEILATVNALPEAGGGGGTEIETCTVTVNCEGTINLYAYMAVEAGKLVAKGTINYSAALSTRTLNNVLCGSVFVVADDIITPDTPKTVNATQLCERWSMTTAFSIDAPAGGEATITLGVD